jgi:hypothetical protein
MTYEEIKKLEDLKREIESWEHGMPFAALRQTLLILIDQQINEFYKHG